MSTVRCLRWMYRNDDAQSWGCVETRDVAHGSRKTGLIGFLVVGTMRRGIFCTKNDGSACPTAPFSFKPMFLTTQQAGKKKTPLHTVEGWVIKTSYRSSRPVGLSLLPGKPKQRPHQWCQWCQILWDLGMVDGLGAYWSFRNKKRAPQMGCIFFKTTNS